MLWEVDLTNSNFHWTLLYLALTRERILSQVWVVTCKAVWWEAYCDGGGGDAWPQLGVTRDGAWSRDVTHHNIRDTSRDRRSLSAITCN